MSTSLNLSSLFPTQSTNPAFRIASLSTSLGDIRARLSWKNASLKFVLLCLLWYLSSAMSNNSAKQILMTFKYPVTLTFVQFGFISGWCLLLAVIQKFRGPNRRALFGARYGIQIPTIAIIISTLPLSLFQIAGHVFGSLATSQIPVSVVHTVKALSPLFTVLTYRFMFNVPYSPSTYLSLLPLTLGVMLACSFELSANIVGLFYALGSTLVFVSQNIFIKRLHFQESSESMNGATAPTTVKGMFRAPQEKEKLDKLNILFYSSGMAFLLMIPIWLYNEGGSILWHYLFGELSAFLNASSPSLTVPFIFNGTVHFGQNILAFALLSVASPVSYSIAGLVKRIFVIVISILWFGQKTTLVQASGIVMTFIGLYMYDHAKLEVARGERKVQRIETKERHLLPLNTSDLKSSSGVRTSSDIQPLSASSATEKFDGPPRRRSLSNTDRAPHIPYINYKLEGVKESPQGPQDGLPQNLKSGNKMRMPNGHWRRSSFGIHANERKVNGFYEFQDGIEEKASWE